MSSTATASQLLAETLLGEPLSEYVDRKRSARPRWPWQLIAEQLTEDTGGKVNLSAEWLRQLYRERAEDRRVVSRPLATG